MIQKKQKCDVAVIGAGVAGVCAAVASSRNGLKTVIIEKHDFPGGVAVSAMNRSICGLYNNYINEKGVIGNLLNKGLLEEICEFLLKVSSIKKAVKIGRVYVLPFSTKDIIDVFWHLINCEKNIVKCFNSTVVGAIQEKDAISEIMVENMDEKVGFIPKAVIDCSGNSIISKMIGITCQVAEPDQFQLSGYSAKVKGLVKVDDMLRVKVPYSASELVSKGDASEYLKYTTFSPGDSHCEGYIRINMPYSLDKDAINVAQNSINRLFSFLSEKLPEFKNACIERLGSEVCPREGARLCGEYTLTEEDVLNARKLPNGKVKGAWPIEMWIRNQGTKYSYIKDNDYYEIPSECLKSSKILNLFAAGRCISVSHEALGSTRVMGTCMSLGEAAGLLVAKYLMG